MTKVEAIIREDKMDEVKQALDDLGCGGMTIIFAKGAGGEVGELVHFRGNAFREKYIPRVKIEVVVFDPLVEEVVWTIRNTAFTGEIGDGRIFLVPVNEAIRIRTGERGNQAI